MSRRLAGRAVLDGTLVAVTPLHVGSGASDAQSDLPLLRDAAGRWVIPGTSIAGALRAWVRASSGLEAEERLFGAPPAGRGIADDHSSAGLIDVADAYVNGDSPLAELRDGVGIDRVTGAAATEIKHDRVVLPRGTRLKLQVTLEVARADGADAERPPVADPDLEILRRLGAALVAGHLRLGGAQTRGLGRVELEHCRLRWLALGTRDGVLALVADGEAAGVQVDCGDCPVRHDPVLEIAWTPALPMLVGAGAEGNAVDTLPLRSATRRGYLAPVLPGSAIKGVLRTRAERIVRTVLDLPALEPVGRDGSAHYEQLAVPLVDHLFGVAPTERSKQSDARRGALGVDDCYAKLELPAEQWHAIQTAERPTDGDQFAALRMALRGEGREGWIDLDPRSQRARFAVPAMHNVLDRWTGGTVPGLLFSGLELHGCGWDPIVLTLRPQLLGYPGDAGGPSGADDHPMAALALLWLVLRDLRDGLLAFGGGTNRGLGGLRDVEIAQSGALTVGDIAFDGAWWMAAEAPDVLVTSWRRWVGVKRGHLFA